METMHRWTLLELITELLVLSDRFGSGMQVIIYEEIDPETSQEWHDFAVTPDSTDGDKASAILISI